MKILSMHVENFLSFGEAEFDFQDQGLVLVEGENKDDESARSNGSGKSAMIDALVWCLFGVTLRGYANDEVIHRKVGEDCLVSVFVKNDKGTFAINRARQHSKFKNRLSVTNDDGEDVSGPGSTETQAIVEKLLGCTMRTFLSSVVFGQDRAYRFSSLTDKEQKEILDEVLGVERFALACQAARARASSTEVAVDEASRALERAEQARDSSDAEVKELREKDKHYSAELKVKVAAEEEKIEAARKWVKKNAVVDVDRLKADLDRCRKEIVACEKAVTKISANATDARVLQGQLRMKVDELRAHLGRHDALTGGDCPTCGQEIRGQTKAAVRAALKKKLKDAYELADIADGTVERIGDDLSAVKAQLKAARDAALAAEKLHNEAVGALANVKAWQQKVDVAKERIAELKVETNPYAALLKKEQARYEKHRKETELLAKQVEAEQARLKLAEFWVEAFGQRGLRSLLLDTSLPVLNAEAGRVSRAITGGTISIEFSATSELKSGKTVDRFEVKVDNEHGAGTYKGNSAGERAKVDLCVGLALQRLVASRSSASFNLIFLDEIFDSLDSAAHERVVEVLSEIEKESVFVVSHNEDLKAWFPAVLTIVKEDGFSRVES